ncbi:hypothetical protein LNN31_10315 [Acetobacterium wieringae]|uniref:Four helix bundle protein n=1 Tax=Acetobacterium wieringae TaxID=52694 RepID=A0ABY6HB47_9FIRM|nr:hypothetical protein [Acetobacterium wieringae]UYO61179.1 hypothetical protein LNN31_10315 [Acetobacterium wieringae]
MKEEKKYNNDYIMRMIEDMSAFLANVRICGSKAFERAYLLQKKAGFW